MGTCCDEARNDYELVNFNTDNDKNSKKTFSRDFQIQTNNKEKANDIMDSNMNKKNNYPPKLFISKKKLKLIVKESKCLMEGKEYIINSLGLINSKNSNKDGLTIFGDTNVINKYYIIYNLFKFKNIDK